MTAGLDEPDHRGRTGLDRAGRDLTRNPGVVVRDVELVASGWHVLRRTTFDYRHRDGRWSTAPRGRPTTGATAPSSSCTMLHGPRCS